MTADFPSLHVSSHPAVLHKLALLRSQSTEPKKFRELVRELSQFLLYEATLDLPLHPLAIDTPLAPLEGRQIGVQLGLVPIPKSGNVDRLRQNLEVFDFELDDADLAEIAALEDGSQVSGLDPRTHEEF